MTHGPGSPAAGDAGCTCLHTRFGPVVVFTHPASCPLHGLHTSTEGDQ